MNKVAIAACCGLLLAACQTVPPEQQEDPEVFGRVDCRRSANDPEVAALYQQDSAVCLGRAQAASLSGTAAMHGQGIVGGLDKAITSNNIGKATLISCMAERGYLYKRKSEHNTMCEAIAAHKAKRR